jgi:hypothetical protein
MRSYMLMRILRCAEPSPILTFARQHTETATNSTFISTVKSSNGGEIDQCNSGPQFDEGTSQRHAIGSLACAPLDYFRGVSPLCSGSIASDAAKRSISSLRRLGAGTSASRSGVGQDWSLAAEMGKCGQIAPC